MEVGDSMTVKEQAEYIRERLPDKRFQHYVKLDEARAMLFVNLAITDRENEIIKNRLVKKAMKEASKIH